MNTPLWLSVVIAVVSPAAAFWGTHRSDQRERYSQQEQAKAELRELRRTAYLNFSAKLPAVLAMTPADPTAIENHRSLHYYYLAVEMYGSGLMRSFARDIYETVTTNVHRRLVTGDATREETQQVASELQLKVDVFMVGARWDLDVPRYLDGVETARRDWRWLGLKKKNVTSADFWDDINVLKEKARALGIELPLAKGQPGISPVLPEETTRNNRSASTE